MKQRKYYKAKHNMYRKIVKKIVKIPFVYLRKMKIKTQQERRHSSDANTYNIKQYKKDSSNPNLFFLFIYLLNAIHFVYLTSNYYSITTPPTTSISCWLNVVNSWQMLLKDEVPIPSTTRTALASSAFTSEF